MNLTVQSDIRSDCLHVQSGSSFEEQVGYARAVAVGNDVYVSGTTGYDYPNMNISDDAAEQAEQCFKNIRGALEAAGARFEHVVCLRIYLPSRTDWPAIAAVVSRWCRAIRPTSTAVLAGLIDEKMKVEIEVLARKPPSA